MNPARLLSLVTASTLLCAALGVPAIASPVSGSGYSKAYDACMNATSSTAGMLDCIARETRSQDARLNANYQAAIKTLAPQQRTALRDVQRQWMQFRDADCALEQGVTGGTVDRINASMCLLQATQVRADTLAVRYQPQAR
ncbi:lysozyme inhibitor LprI family protein [Pseudomonas sp. HR96]|uniref:lysozyme inhibitor LprI family protein n=1 Tax=Pseudomonas sp. HR96 TaxID=1027966 RepID=UPI002A766B51|nr:lysozyme inhibitor LprI family protein [Pseudomonas sp. HR96]WPO98252.1 lysozyme inhibitor LprI family protein [Pseudomonas sp. HR96]